MPHLRIHALEKNQVAQLSQELIPVLAQATNTAADHFTVEHIPSSYFVAGQAAYGDPFCEVLWFDRGQAMQDQVAIAITEQIKKIQPDKDAVVVFTPLAKSSYYENGSHFGSK